MVTILVLEISCSGRLLNYPILVIVAIVGFIFFGEKWKPFDHWKEEAVMEFNLNGSIK